MTQPITEADQLVYQFYNAASSIEISAIVDKIKELMNKEYSIKELYYLYYCFNGLNNESIRDVVRSIIERIKIAQSE